ncbi:tape measure chaperone [Proteus phage Stubb]|uniref:Tape measure chaperone n=2 Tax=Novosibvirus TaxID=2560189 RepID=A0A2H4PRI6_9CAUD|nr:hypothetical protein FDJ15_gp014 [Proteus phage PM135]YP_009814694.1 tape measure chaperone [Proteus phage Stubb]ATW69897.1 hypothetical protein [Proteus phage PM135]AYJ73275.1 tape measure chaperone [Proteus phage Stubb]
MSISISAIKAKTDKKYEVTLNYPGVAGFEVTLRYTPNHVLTRIMERSEKIIMVNGRAQGRESDVPKFCEAIAEEAMVSWEGLTVKKLADLILVDLEGSGVEDLDAEVPFSLANAADLLKECPAFMEFVTGSMTDIGNFRTI